MSKHIAPRGTRYLERTAAEPPAGSIVMLEGPTGTAYQRLFSTERWHSTTQGISVSFSWAELRSRAARQGAYPVLLVFEAPSEDDLPDGLSPASVKQQQEIDELVQATGAPVDSLAARTRSEAASLLITLRAYAKEKGVAQPSGLAGGSCRG
jgi:hypothetical protein